MATIRTAAAQPTLRIRRVIPSASLMSFQGEALGLLWRAAQQSSASQVAPVVVRYWSMENDTVDVEVALPIAELVDLDAGEVVVDALPGGGLMEHRHVGSHDTLGDAYGDLAAAVGDRATSGPAWEVYEWIPQGVAPDPASWPSPAEWTTLLVQPLEPEERR